MAHVWQGVINEYRDRLPFADDVKISMFLVNSGILIRKPIWTILKKRKNALTLSMFVSTRISLKPVKLAQTMTFVVFSQIAWLNSNLTRL